jgi:hypothetical protein
MLPPKKTKNAKKGISLKQGKRHSTASDEESVPNNAGLSKKKKV